MRVRRFFVLLFRIRQRSGNLSSILSGKTHTLAEAAFTENAVAFRSENCPKADHYQKNYNVRKGKRKGEKERMDRICGIAEFGVAVEGSVGSYDPAFNNFQ